MVSATQGRIPTTLKRAGRWQTWSRSRDPLLPLETGGRLPASQRGRIVAHIKFEYFSDYDDSPWSISILGTHKSEGCVAVDKKTTAQSLLVFDHPVSSIVLTDHEYRRRAHEGGSACLASVIASLL
jgi:hypothetical protein